MSVELIFCRKPVLRDHDGAVLPDATHYQIGIPRWIGDEWRVSFDLFRVDDNGRWYVYSTDADDEYPSWVPIDFSPNHLLPLEVRE